MVEFITKNKKSLFCGNAIYLLEPWQRTLLLVVILTQVASTLVELLSLWLLTKVMSSFVDGSNLTTLQFFEEFGWNVNTAIALVAMSSLLAAFFKIFSQAIMIRYVQSLRKHFAKIALHDFQKKDFIELKNTKKSEATKVVLSESDQIVQYYFQPLTILTSKLSIILIFVCYSFFKYTSEMAIVFSALFVIYFLYYVVSSKAIKSLALARNEANSLRVMAAEDFIRLAKDFKLSGYRNYLLDHFETAAEQFKEILSRLQIITFVPRYLVEAFAVCLLCLGIYLSVQDIFVMDVEFLITILVVSYRVLPAVQGAFSAKQSMDFARPLINAFHSSQNQEITYLPFENYLHLHGITSSHSVGEIVYSFEKIEISKGDMLIIVGPSGVGKTTFLEVVLGLRHNPSVRVECDGVVLTMKNRISNISYVEQHPNLFNATVIDNICMRPASTDDRRHIVNLVNRWNDNDLKDLVAKNIEINDEGTNLSGGQRQKIALMRAIHKMPKLLVLDEATSGFDELSLKKFIGFLDELDITVIWVTHDDRIVQKSATIIELAKSEKNIKVIVR